MQGLKRLPSMAELREALNRVQAQAPIGEGDLALYSQWARLEPRLAEGFVTYLGARWHNVATGNLLKNLAEQPWPRAILVLLNFAVASAVPSEEFGLRSLADLVEASFPKPAPELFFVPLQVPPRVVLEDEIRFRTLPYSRAGYIGSQSLLARARYPADKTWLGPEERRRILEELIGSRSTFSVNDYILACRHLVSRRQAQRDLAQLPGLSKTGYSRRRRYSNATADRRG